MIERRTERKKSRGKKISLYLQAALYIGAGVNHFVHPGLYYRIIPPYMPDAPLINKISGAVEIISGALLLFRSTRSMAVYLIIAMLIAFVPAHIYMIQISKCCLPLWIAWLRLIPGQLLLIYWAYYVRDLRYA